MNTLVQNLSYRPAAVPSKRRTKTMPGRTVSVEPCDKGVVVLLESGVRRQRSVAFDSKLGEFARSLEGLIHTALLATSSASYGDNLSVITTSLDATRKMLLASAPGLRAETVSEPRARTKSTQHTIGVLSTTTLKELLGTRGDASFAECAREVFVCGLERLDERLWSEDSALVLNDFRSMYKRFEEGAKEQWSLRVAKSHYSKALTIAKEYGLSQSYVACMCLAAGIDMPKR
jgi:hypothetical protein